MRFSRLRSPGSVKSTDSSKPNSAGHHAQGPASRKRSAAKPQARVGTKHCDLRSNLQPSAENCPRKTGGSRFDRSRTSSICPAAAIPFHRGRHDSRCRHEAARKTPLPRQSSARRSTFASHSLSHGSEISLPDAIRRESEKSVCSAE